MAMSGRGRSNEPRFAGRAVIFGLAIALVLLLAVQSSPNIRGAIDASRSRMDDASTRISATATEQVSGLTWIFADKASKERIRELEAEVRALNHWRDASRAMSARLQEYERMLDLMAEPKGESVTARIVAEVNGPFSHSKIANAGGNQGVEEGFAAVNEHGLVGRVIRTGQDTSRILLVNDYNSRIPVMGRSSLDRALLVGDQEFGARLEHAETPDKIVEGEEWVTSGDDGVFQRGITVGFARRDGDLWKVDLSMHRSGLGFVRLIPPPDRRTPESEEADQPVGNETQPSALAGQVEDNQT